jgi:hypothetical protein
MIAIEIVHSEIVDFSSTLAFSRHFSMGAVFWDFCFKVMKQQHD